MEGNLESEESEVLDEIVEDGLIGPVQNEVWESPKVELQIPQ